MYLLGLSLAAALLGGLFQHPLGPTPHPLVMVRVTRGPRAPGVLQQSQSISNRARNGSSAASQAPGEVLFSQSLRNAFWPGVRICLIWWDRPWSACRQPARMLKPRVAGRTWRLAEAVGAWSSPS